MPKRYATFSGLVDLIEYSQIVPHDPQSYEVNICH